jgi:demethylmenaquinone methyltransferase/2-methoxy-6-polyprenyl-1,4-benzoquinol methylase
MGDTRTQRPEELATSFGFEGVREGEKQPKVNEVFHSVAKRYDVMNDFMSMGMHRVWKEAMVANLSPPKSGSHSWKTIDVAGGTGDIAFRIVEASNKTAHTTVFDINGSMLEVGRERAEKNGLLPHLDFVEGTAEVLPFEDNSFDAYTIAFGIRNVPRIDHALAEAYRVLRPGGRFMCLEFSEVDMPILEQVYEQWSFKAIPAIGKAVTGDRESYQYLVESIRKFPDQKTFAGMIETAKFEKVSFKNYSGGIVALHSGWKI